MSPQEQIERLRKLPYVFVRRQFGSGAMRCTPCAYQWGSKLRVVNDATGNELNVGLDRVRAPDAISILGELA